VFKSLVLGRPVVSKILVERIPLEAVPEDPEEAAKWLHQNYVHKVNLCLILNVFSCCIVSEYFNLCVY